jgi:hypothetical protein
MADREGQQVDTLPVQCYGWDYVNSVPVKILVDEDGKLEVA